MPVYVIEHLEQRMWKWSFIEYKHISKIVGKENLWFTNTKSKKLDDYGKVIRESVSNLDLKNVCVLDPSVEKTLTPTEAKKFNYFIFGGILGDYPRRRRTKRELTQFIKNAEVRNIGKGQFSTDGAVYVVKKIVEGTPLSEIKFKDGIKIPINKISDMDFPFRYAIVNDKPLISEELVRYLKRRRSF